MKRLAFVAFTGFVTVIPVFGQSTTTPGNQGGQANMSSAPGEPGSLHPAYISGKVLMQDGTPVPQNVTIQRICGGVAKTVAYTSPNGHFSFQWGDRNVIVADASDAGADPSRNSSTSPAFGSSQSAGGGNILAADPYGKKMINCQLRANVAGFTSDTINLLNQRPGESSDIGLIVLRRVAGVEGSSISVTAMLAPKDAKKAYDRGLQFLVKNDLEAAGKEFEKAVARYPQYADAWVNLGKVRLQQKASQPARTAFMKAIEADPKLIPAYVELGLMAARDADWKQSAEYLGKALQLDPMEYPQTWYADAVAHFNLGDYAAAEKSAREAVRLDPKHANARANYLLGLVLFEKREYAGAASELATYVKLAPNAPDLTQAQDRLKEAEKLGAERKQQ